MSTQLYRNAILCLLSLGIIASPVLASRAAAQSIETNATPASAQAAQAAPAPPEPSPWTRSITFSVMWLSSTQSQTAISLSGDATRTSEHWVHAIAGDESLVRVSFGGQSVTVADSQNLRYMARYIRTPASRIYFIFRPAYKRNTIQAVDYRFEELFGVGFQAAKSPRFNLDVIPAAGAVQQRKNIESVDGNHFAVGVYENAGGIIARKMVNNQLAQSWSWSQFLLYLADTQSEDSRLQFQAQMQGTIVPHLSLSLAYNFDRENVVFEGTQQNDQRVTVGLRVEF